MSDNVKSYTHINKPYLIQNGSAIGLWRVEYMYIANDDKKEYFGGKAFYYSEDAKRFYKENKTK